MATTIRPPLIVIVGPTASGKTALAIDLALEFDGEIICADSRTIYKGMDIGTAKPTPEEQRLVPHHLLDLVEPYEVFTAADFKRLANEAIDGIRSRGRVPFLVGGTGLYIDSVLFDYRFGGAADATLRAQLNEMTSDQLIEYCAKNNIELPENSKNKRYLIRAIEQNGINSKRRRGVIEDTLVVGISTNKIILRQRIVQRADQLFASGMLDEAFRIGQKYGWSHESMTGNIYRLAGLVHRGELSVEGAKQKFVTADWRLAKRQLTWLRRNPFIQWGSLTEVRTIVGNYLK
jgi:tRNA dimethylallyltransferase